MLLPPISALRILFALATTRKAPDLDGKMRDLPKDQCLVFLDIKKAHFWAEARRRLLIELPLKLALTLPNMLGFCASPFMVLAMLQLIGRRPSFR